MKKIMIPIIMVLFMVGSVIAVDVSDDDFEPASLTGHTKEMKGLSFIEDIKYWASTFSLFSVITYNGVQYTCDEQVSYNMKIYPVDNKICYSTTSHNGVQVQIFRMNAAGELNEAYLGEKTALRNGPAVCFEGLDENRLHNVDLYYCDTPTEGGGCVDYDGLDYHVDSYVKQDHNYFYDSCKNSETVLEQKCEIGRREVEYDCSNTGANYECRDNACRQKQITCYKCVGTSLETKQDTSCYGEWSEETLSCGNGGGNEGSPECGDGHCVSGETAENCPSDCTQGCGDDCGSGERDPPVNPIATYPELTPYKNPTYNIISDYKVEVTYYIKNVGVDMPEKWILEVQPDDEPEGIMALFGFVGTQETCDPNYPENIHKDFQLKSGEKGEIKLTLDVPPTQTFAGGNTYLFPIIRKGCVVDKPKTQCENDFTGCSAGDGCYQMPYCDGKSDVYYENPSTGAKSQSSIPVLKTGSETVNKCNRILGQSCTPVDIAGADDSGPSDECETGWCQDKAGTGGICAPVGTLGDGDIKDVAQPHPTCVSLGTTTPKDPETEADLCAWTTWAPEGFLGKCGNAYGLIILVLLIFYAIMNQNKGGQFQGGMRR